MVRILKLTQCLRLKKGRVGNFRQQRARPLGLVFPGQFGGGAGNRPLLEKRLKMHPFRGGMRGLDTNQMLFPACSVQFLLVTS